MIIPNITRFEPSTYCFWESEYVSRTPLPHPYSKSPRWQSFLLERWQVSFLHVFCVKLSLLCKLSKNHKNCKNISGPSSAQMHFPTKKPWASGNSTPSALQKTILHVHHQSPIAVHALKEGVFLAARLMKRPKWKTTLPKTNLYNI